MADCLESLCRYFGRKTLHRDRLSRDVIERTAAELKDAEKGVVTEGDSNLSVLRGCAHFRLCVHFSHEVEEQAEANDAMVSARLQGRRRGEGGGGERGGDNTMVEYK